MGEAYTFCGEVVKLLVVSVHNDLLFVGVLERLGPGDVTKFSSDDVGALGKSNSVSSP